MHHVVWGAVKDACVFSVRLVGPRSEVLWCLVVYVVLTPLERVFVELQLSVCSLQCAGVVSQLFDLLELFSFLGPVGDGAAQ